MQRLLGWAVFFVGIAGLFIWSYIERAEIIQNKVQNNAISALKDQTDNPLEIEVSGRDVILSGTAYDEAERQTILERAKTIEGYRVIIDELDLLPEQSPYQFTLVKAEGQATTGHGYAPNLKSQQELSRFGDVELASGAPENWDEAITGLSTVLEKSISSEAVMTGKSIKLHARVDTDAEALAIEADLVQSGFFETIETSFDIDRPRVSPFTLDITNEAGQISVSGYAPDVNALQEIEAAYGGKADLKLGSGAPENWSGFALLGADFAHKLSSGQVMISDQTMEISGDVENQEVLDSLIALSKTVPEGYEINLAVDPLVETIRPFTFSAEKTAEGAIALAGYGSSAGEIDKLNTVAAALGSAVSGEITRANGVPSEDWGDKVAQNLDLLRLLKSGRLDVSDQEMVLSGVVDTDDDLRSLTQSAEQNGAKLGDILVENPSLPYATELSYDANQGVSVGGSIPTGLDMQALQNKLGAPSLGGDVDNTAKGDQEHFLTQLSDLSSWLPNFETATAQITADQVTISGTTSSATDVELLASHLRDIFGDNAIKSIKATDIAYEQGQRRKNPLTGDLEEYMLTSWLPVLDFAPDAENCSAQAQSAQERQKIAFITGSARLDSQARSAIDRLASVALRCLNNPDKELEIGGHTDSDGDEAANQALSLDRANAVAQALIARGVDGGRLKPIGYGESKPVASNDTAEGKAENRRITFKWLDIIAEDSTPTTSEPASDAGEATDTTQADQTKAEPAAEETTGDTQNNSSGQN